MGTSTIGRAKTSSTVGTGGAIPVLSGKASAAVALESVQALEMPAAVAASVAQSSASGGAAQAADAEREHPLPVPQHLLPERAPPALLYYFLSS